MNKRIETLTGIKNVWDEFSEKVFGSKIMTDGTIKEQIEKFSLEDKIKLTSKFDKYTTIRSDQIEKKVFEIENATYIIVIDYIMPIYERKTIYKVSEVYLENDINKDKLKSIRTKLSRQSLNYSDSKIKRLANKTK